MTDQTDHEKRMIGFQLKFKDFQAGFLDSRAIRDPVDRAAKSRLTIWGGLVRKVARNSIRPARQKSESEMLPAERQAWAISRDKALRAGRRPYRRPGAPSKPGEPPRGQSGLLRRSIFYAMVGRPGGRGAVAGPFRTRSDGAEALEKTGVYAITRGPNRGKRIGAKPRTFMAPAAEVANEKLPALWAGSIRR